MSYLGGIYTTFDPTRTTPVPRDADRFSGDGSTTAFTLSRSVQNPVDVEVFVNNVQQEPIVAYNLVGTTLTFTSAPASGTNNIYVLYRTFDSGLQVSVPDGSITNVKLVENIKLFTVDNFTANGSGNTFVLSETPANANTLSVSVNGSIQSAPLHYSTSGTTLTLVATPSAGANVRVQHLGFRSTATLSSMLPNTVIPTPNLTSPTITGSVSGSATYQTPSLASPTISGTVGGSATYTTPTLTSPTFSGTSTNFQSTGIDDNASSTAITITSGQLVGIGTTVTTGASGAGTIVIKNGSYIRYVNAAGTDTLPVISVQGDNNLYLGADTNSPSLLITGSMLGTPGVNKLVSMGAADSGGSGYKVLRVPNN